MLDDILIQASEIGWVWLSRLFNKVLMIEKMDEWSSVVVPVYITKEIYNIAQIIMGLNL